MEIEYIVSGLLFYIIVREVWVFSSWACGFLHSKNDNDKIERLESKIEDCYETIFSKLYETPFRSITRNRVEETDHRARQTECQLREFYKTLGYEWKREESKTIPARFVKVKK